MRLAVCCFGRAGPGATGSAHAARPVESARAALKTILDTPMSLDYYIHASFNIDGRVYRVQLKYLK
jgi:hypothetical protein